MQRTLLIDADVLVHVAASKHEVETDWGDGLWTLHSQFEPARVDLDADVQRFQEELKADHIVMALSDYNEPWRKKVLPTYKSNRKGVRKPIIFGALRQYIHEKYTTFQRPGLEGDDVLGILLTAPKPPPFVKGERIVCSIDKDMKTLPGLHFNLLKLESGQQDWEENIVEISEAEADRFHMTQTLTGDTTDGYKGCPGVGKVSAEKVLGEATTVGEMWPLVVAAYAKAGLGEEEALTQARIARICRASDYNFETRKVILWSP